MPLNNARGFLAICTIETPKEPVRVMRVGFANLLSFSSKQKITNLIKISRVFLKFEFPIIDAAGVGTE